MASTRCPPSRRAMLAGLATLTATGCAAPAVPPLGATAATPSPNTWPGAEWERIAPEQAGWDAAGLAAAQDYAKGIGTAAFTVVHHGRVVDEWGETTRRLELHSVRKSLLSALIGIAVAERKIDLGATLASLGIDDVAPSLTAAEKAATVRQLLQSRSGVYHEALYETPGEVSKRPPRGSHEPGSFWYYNNWDFNVLGTIYERAVGSSLFEAFATRIARPLSMQDYRVADGRYVRGEATSAHPAYPFRMTARDLARFGLLYARGGMWRGQSVVPATWVRESTTGYSTTSIGSGYAYLWWTAFPDRPVPVLDMPPGGFWADGAHGQFIWIDPANDLVAVHQTDGDDVTRRQMGHLMWLVQTAARVQEPGSDPGNDLGPARGRRRRT